MANYRPKSLNELNTLYDKSMAAQNAIKKSGSAITADSEEKQINTEVETGEAVSNEKTPSQIASDELSEALSGFIKTFGEADSSKDKPVVRQPLPITKAVKSTAAASNKKSTKEDTSDTAEAHSHQEEKKEKPILMRNAERSELLDDYMKIMNDDDDDVAYLKNIIKKKKKNKKDKHQGSPLQEAEAEQSNSDESEAGSPAYKDEEEYGFDADSEVQAEENDAPEQPDEEDTSDASKQEETAPASKKIKRKKDKNLFLQIFFMLLLLAVLVSAVSVTLLNVVTNADSNDPITDKYSLFTVDSSFEKAGLVAGDLVITESKAVAQDDAFAYKNSYGETVFAVKGTQIGTDRFMAHCDGEVDLIEESTVRGVIIKTIPSVGSIVKILTDNFIIIISVLIAVALIIILILALAFRSKSNYEIDDSEYSDSPDEASDEADNNGEQLSDEEPVAEEDYYEDAEEGNLFETID